jgi:hypothetical protein
MLLRSNMKTAGQYLHADDRSCARHASAIRHSTCIDLTGMLQKFIDLYRRPFVLNTSGWIIDVTNAMVNENYL